MDCLKDYLIEKNHPELDNIPTSDLNEILKNFYSEVRKKTNDLDNQDDAEMSGEYKNSTPRAIRAVLVRYFKDTRGIDIIRNEQFISSNEMFLAMTKTNKEKGLGDINSYPPINEADLSLITEYFKKKMYGAPDPGYSNR